MEGRRGKRLGIRHPKRKGQREMERGADRARQSHTLYEGTRTEQTDLEGAQTAHPLTHTLPNTHAGAADTWWMRTHRHTHP